MARAQIGPVLLWGDIPENDTPGSTNYIMVSAAGTPAVGGGHTLAINASTRKLDSWGKNTYCQRGFCPGSPDTPRISPPSGLLDMTLKAISTGNLHSLAIRKAPGTSNDNVVLGWGHNSYGQAEVPSGLKAKVVSAGESGSAAIDMDGLLVVWGGIVPDPVPEDEFVTVSMGNTFGIALKADGHLFAWGSNEFGNPVYHANVTHADDEFVSVYAGDSHWVAVRKDGVVIAKGHLSYGQCASQSGTFQAVSTGDWHSFGWRVATNTGGGGGLEVWGRNDEGQGEIPSGEGPFSMVDGAWLYSAGINDSRVCYANCDGSRTLPIVDANDFLCFAARYAAGDTYANCDGSTSTPVLTINDFMCFANQAACGCEYTGTPNHPCDQ